VNPAYGQQKIQKRKKEKRKTLGALSPVTSEPLGRVPNIRTVEGVAPTTLVQKSSNSF